MVITKTNSGAFFHSLKYLTSVTSFTIPSPRLEARKRIIKTNRAQKIKKGHHIFDTEVALLSNTYETLKLWKYQIPN